MPRGGSQIIVIVAPEFDNTNPYGHQSDLEMLSAELIKKGVECVTLAGMMSKRTQHNIPWFTLKQDYDDGLRAFRAELEFFLNKRHDANYTVFIYNARVKTCSIICEISWRFPEVHFICNLLFLQDIRDTYLQTITPNVTITCETAKGAKIIKKRTGPLVDVVQLPLLSFSSRSSMEQSVDEKEGERGALLLASLNTDRNFLLGIRAHILARHSDPYLPPTIKSETPGSWNLIRNLIPEKFMKHINDYEVLDDWLPDIELSKLIESSKYTIIPYSDKVFHARPSGIFIRSIVSNTPPIVLRNTWMADELRAFDLEELISRPNINDLVKTIENTETNLVLIRDKISQAHLEIRKRYGSHQILDFLASRA